MFSQAVAGDRSAFAELVRKHQAMVFSIALHSLRDESLAEELAQEVFLDFYNHLGDLQSAAHAEFWLRKVAGAGASIMSGGEGGSRVSVWMTLRSCVERSGGTRSVSVGDATKLTSSLPEKGADDGGASLSGRSGAGRDRRDIGYSAE